MTKALGRVLAIASALVITGVLTLATSPLQASSVDQRIETLEQELTRLKKAQADTREQAIAAQKKMPLFIYRPGSGLTIAAADDKWEIQFGNRLQVYWTFWTKGGDGTSITSEGTTNGVLQIRRFRPYMNTRINDGFYDLRFQLTNGSTASPNFFDAEMYIHFENISPWLPYFGFGASPSAILNPQDNNLSSARGARSEPGGSLAAQPGPGTGSPDRGMGFVWRALPRLGPVRISFLNAWVGQDGQNAWGDLASDGITRDGRSFTAGVGVRPFDKMGGSFGKLMKGLEVSFGTRIYQSPQNETGWDRWRIRTAQTRAHRVDLIRTPPNGMAGTTYYFTPGLGWKWQWITLNLAGHFYNSRACVDKSGDCATGNPGALVRTAGWQFIGSFWLWSPKSGLLAGNEREGGLVVSPLFGRVNAWGASDSLDNCQPGASAAARRCGSAHAVQAGIGIWYYIPGRFMNVGVVWDHWMCSSCNGDIKDVVPGGQPGDDVDFDTITLISRFQF